MRACLAALAFCSLAACLPAARLDLEPTLKALRGTDKAQLLATLQSIPGLPGFPKSAEPLAPALVWIEDGDDVQLAIAAKAVATQIGWPQHYCLPCLRKFAARQDEAYKLMGLSALLKLVWDDPEAMWTLMDICENAKASTAQHARRISQRLSRIACPDRMALDAWNDKAGPVMGRFQASIIRSTYKSRFILQTLSQCQDLLPELHDSAKAAFEKLPPRTNALQEP